MSTKFKTRINYPLNIFRDHNLTNAINLRKLIWKLKQGDSQYTIYCEVIDKTNPYQSATNSPFLYFRIIKVFKTRHQLISTRSKCNSKSKHKAKNAFLDFKPNGLKEALEKSPNI